MLILCVIKLLKNKKKENEVGLREIFQIREMNSQMMWHQHQAV